MFNFIFVKQDDQSEHIFFLLKNKTLDQWDSTVDGTVLREVIGIEAAAEIGVTQKQVMRLSRPHLLQVLMPN